MAHTERITQIKSSDFEAFVSDVAAAIWNQLIKNQAFRALKVSDYPGIFDAVAQALSHYRI